MSFKDGDRVVVRAGTLLLGTIVGGRIRPYNKPVRIIDIGGRGGPLECEDWELTPATALDELTYQLEYGVEGDV